MNLIPNIKQLGVHIHLEFSEQDCPYSFESKNLKESYTTSTYFSIVFDGVYGHFAFKPNDENCPFLFGRQYIELEKGIIRLSFSLEKVR